MSGLHVYGASCFDGLGKAWYSGKLPCASVPQRLQCTRHSLPALTEHNVQLGAVIVECYLCDGLPRPARLPRTIVGITFSYVLASAGGRTTRIHVPGLWTKYRLAMAAPAPDCQRKGGAS